MLREETVFGPIRSRRLGRSLGINLLPTKGKICNFDCIYCECGLNADGLADRKMPSRAVVRCALEAKLADCLLEGTRIDSITFSGDGEPTLNPEFPEIVDDVLKLRDIYEPSAKVSVLSNATTLSRPGIVEALKKVDNPILKLDAPTTDLARRINRPAAPYDVFEVFCNLSQFDGDFILQTIFLKSKEFDSASPEVLGPWMEMVLSLKPREVMVYTVDRPTPLEGIGKYSAKEMETMVAPLVEAGIKVKIYG